MVAPIDPTKKSFYRVPMIVFPHRKKKYKVTEKRWEEMAPAFVCSWEGQSQLMPLCVVIICQR